MVLIIAPWNYPLNLILVPLVGAIAAGERPASTSPGPSLRASRGPWSSGELWHWVAKIVRLASGSPRSRLLALGLLVASLSQIPHQRAVRPTWPAGER